MKIETGKCRGCDGTIVMQPTPSGALIRHLPPICKVFVEEIEPDLVAYVESMGGKARSGFEKCGDG